MDDDCFNHGLTQLDSTANNNTIAKNNMKYTRGSYKSPTEKFRLKSSCLDKKSGSDGKHRFFFVCFAYFGS